MNESELLLTEILHCDRLSLYLNKERILDKDKSALIASALKRRITGEPIQYILGKTEFMGLEFKVTPDVFIPRPETEILVETAIKIVRQFASSPVRQLRILDIGTGSGCIAIVLAKLLSDENISIIAADISAQALKIAQDNARLNNVTERVDFIHSRPENLALQGKDEKWPLSISLQEATGFSPWSFIQSDLFTPYAVHRTPYDIIVSNPPYIPTSQIDNLQPEIKYEPKIALNGGRDGLDFYRHLIVSCADYLKENGLLILEIGFNQKEQIGNIFQKSAKFEIIEVVKDYNGIDRVIVSKLK